MSDERTVPYYCPYCGGEELRPHDASPGTWDCRECLRSFALRRLTQPADSAPTNAVSALAAATTAAATNPARTNPARTNPDTTNLVPANLVVTL